MSAACKNCGEPVKGHGGAVRCKRCEGLRRRACFRHTAEAKAKISRARKRGGIAKHFCACGKQVSQKGRQCVACSRVKDKAGDVLHGITLLRSTVRKDKHGSVFWLMRCVCGSEFEALVYKVRSRRVKSCGCALIQHLAVLARKQVGAQSPVWISDRSKTTRILRRASGATTRFSTKLKLERGLKCDVTGTVVSSTSELEAHHIEPVVVNPDRGRDRSNVSVVLSELHKEFHRRFGRRTTPQEWHIFVREKAVV